MAQNLAALLASLANIRAMGAPAPAVAAPDPQGPTPDNAGGGLFSGPGVNGAPAGLFAAPPPDAGPSPQIAPWAAGAPAPTPANDPEPVPAPTANGSIGPGVGASVDSRFAATAPAIPPMAQPDVGQSNPLAGAPQLPQLPQAPHINPVFGVLDRMFLGGSVEGIQNLNYKRAMENVVQQRMAEALARAPQSERDALALGGVEALKNFAIHDAPEGSTTIMWGDPSHPIHAPKTGIDAASGTPYSATPDEFKTFPALGGDFTQSAEGITSKRTGDFQGISRPFTAPATDYRGPFTPQLAGGPPAGAPRLGDSPQAPGAGAQPASPNGLDPLAFFRSFVAPHEGGLNPSDMNGSPTNFGINQAANPQVDVHKLTVDDAAKIFADKYFAPSGAASLPAPLAAVHADTAFINPGKAKQFLKQSGGDWQKYMAMRQSWMANMVKRDPAAAKYALAWTRRNGDLSRVAAGLAGAPGEATGQEPAAPPPTPTAGNAPDLAATGGFGTPMSLGAKNTRIAPDEAIRLGYAPGRWERDPMGKPVMVSPAPETDVKRVDSLAATTQGLQALEQEQAAFLAHNRKEGTAPLVYSDINVHGHNLNPIAAFKEGANPDFKAMSASEAKQLFMVKPDNAGGRVLQSELPFWERQTQSVGNTGDVNQGIYHDTQSKLALARVQSNFYTKYLYEHGNLSGVDDAWAKAHSATGPQAHAPGEQRLSPEEAAKLPSGTQFMTLDGRVLVRH